MFHILFALVLFALVAFVVVPVALWLLYATIVLVLAPFVAFRGLMEWIFKPRGRPLPASDDDADWMQDFAAWMIRR